MLKQVIIVRKDLKMKGGKLASQVSHASMGAITQYLVEKKKYQDPRMLDSIGTIDFQCHPNIRAWLFDGSFTKVILDVDSEGELLSIYDTLMNNHLDPVLITDNGTTVFGGVKTNTCVGVPPFVAEEIDKITGHLKLLN